MKLRRPILLLLLAAALAPHSAGAQDVLLRGDDRTRAAQIAREVLARGEYVRIDRDTVLPATFRAPADLVVAGADVRLEGQVEGTAVVLGGDLYLRPGARVGGSIAVIGGGVYPSGRAEYGTIFESNPSSRVVIGMDADSSVLADLTGPPRPGIFSFGPRPLPTYDRVNGATLSAGVALNLTREDHGALLAAWASYRFRNDDPLGGGARLEIPAGAGLRLGAEASRATRTNDAWARGDLGNSLAALLGGNDYRDYYDADRLAVYLVRPRVAPLLAGESWLGPRLALRVEEARSLEGQHPWSLFGELDRPNPPVLDGQINSGILGAELHWVGRLSRVSLDAQVEHGRLLEGPPELHRFTQLLAFGTYQTTAFRTHRLRYSGRVMLPIDGSDAPPQRYGILGGVPTLPTLEIGEMRGDHLVFAEGTYTIPFAALAIRFLGPPALEFRHAVGAAWRSGEDSPWVQNVGAGIVFPLVSVRAAVDPANTDRSRVYLGVSLPTF